MNDFTPIAKHIRYFQLQRSVALSEVLADGFVWLFRSIDRASAVLKTSSRRKPSPKPAAQH